ncbi:MAG: UDP-N-acetylmuramate--L-alanine ligase [Rhodospirillaceae bacterium]|jgi:UDP-N-acetylmuramate--alanine ligase|nr:UDP-N-acetylmuramate--L-alanine ligase [Rhodospirillaceae bacterium]MBT7760851.1 UDP-N-acetylmuramate--L-alanine ligase [Rhodospirillaceae bacterium]
MRTLPLDFGTIHFVGIGGIGMSGIAEVMHNLGYQVQGSDQAEGANVIRLRDLGVKTMVGHAGDNLGEAQVVVISSAVKADNAEVVAAREAMIPVVRRAEMLAELMRLKWAIAVGGTHGKTTTTSMVAAILDHADYDPTVINGGIINAYGTNARLGAGDWMVVEADESDGSFTKLPATIAVVTNMNPEHLDFYGDFEAERAAFQTFVENLPFYGCAVMCLDHPEVQALVGRISDRRVVTYGFSPQAAVRATNLASTPTGMAFDVEVVDRASDQSRLVKGFHLPMHGEHNVLNALAAIAVGQEMKIADSRIQAALAAFAGVKRRFTKTGEAGGITVIDDYGHHPVEIAAVLQAARAATAGRIIAVVQPHRYTRLRDLFEDFCTCFNDADTVIVAPVHAAGETAIEGIDRDAMVQGLMARGHRRVLALGAPEDLPAVIAGEAVSGDMVVCLGAGTITAWANALPEQLAPLVPGPKLVGGAP